MKTNKKKTEKIIGLFLVLSLPIFIAIAIYLKSPKLFAVCFAIHYCITGFELIRRGCLSATIRFFKGKVVILENM